MKRLQILVTTDKGLNYQTVGEAHTVDDAIRLLRDVWRWAK